MPLDPSTASDPSCGFLSGTTGGADVTAAFPPANFRPGTYLFVRDLPGRPLYLLLEDTLGVRSWKRVSEPVLIGFGNSTVVNGTRTMDPGISPARASSAGAPSNVLPSMIAPFAGRAWSIFAKRTNNPVGATCAVTLTVNNVATALTTTIPSALFLNSTTLAVPVSWNAGDLLALQAVNAGGTSNNVVVTLQAEGRP